MITLNIVGLLSLNIFGSLYYYGSENLGTKTAVH